MRKESFIMYTEYQDYFNMLSLEEQGKLIQSLFNFASQDENQNTNKNDLSPATQMAYKFITNQINRDIEKYNEKCLKNKVNGALGGRPKNEKQTDIIETERLSQKANGFSQNPNDNDNDNDIKKENNKKKDDTILTDSDLYTLIDETFKDNDVSSSFKEYALMRKAKGTRYAIRTQGTFNYCVSRLRNLAKNKAEAIEILNNSIGANYQGLFPLKKSNVKELEQVPYAN